MKRRELLKGMLATGLWNVLPGRAGAASPPKDLKGVEDLQNNWMALLADGIKVPTPAQPLKLSKPSLNSPYSESYYVALTGRRFTTS